MDNESGGLKMGSCLGQDTTSKLGLKIHLIHFFPTYLLEYEINTLVYLIENRSDFLICLLENQSQNYAKTMTIAEGTMQKETIKTEETIKIIHRNY